MSGLSPAAYCFLVGVKTHEENNMADQFKCSKCGKTFSSQSELKEHEKNCNKKCLLSRICGLTPVREVVPACDKGPFPSRCRYGIRRICLLYTSDDADD